MIGVANPTDYSTASFAAKNFIAQLHLADNKSKAKRLRQLYWRKKI